MGLMEVGVLEKEISVKCEPSYYIYRYKLNIQLEELRLISRNQYHLS